MVLQWLRKVMSNHTSRHLMLLATIAGFLTLFAKTPLLAQDASALKVDTGDTAWLLVSTAFVMLMTPGLAFFYGGMVRAKNVLNMLMQSFIALGVVTLIWVLWGYSLSFGTGNKFIGSLQFFALNGVGQEPNGDYVKTVPHQIFMMYQMMFAIITPALISGAIAERMKFSTYLVFISLWCTLVYCPLAHWVWGYGGWLGLSVDASGNPYGIGALDFAGGTVVHISSGFSALVLSIMLGKRKITTEENLHPHNLPLTLLGTGLLWFGWFGFNAGSALGSGGLAGAAFMTTHVAAAVAGLTWAIIEWIAYKKPTALGFATGAVAGLVAITPAAGFVSASSAIFIGLGVSIISFFAIKLKNKLKYDDTLDVFAVHGVGGVWGAIATGLFASKAINSAGADGLFAGGGMALLGKQLIAIGSAAGYAAIITCILILVLKATMGLRVSKESEDAGLDLAEHGEAGYSGIASEGAMVYSSD